MNTCEELTGTVDRFLFQNEENGYTVFIVHLQGGKKITVTGHIPHVQPGQQISMVGSWIHHPKFGAQFQTQQCTVCLPTSLKGIEKYLASGMIKGIGPTYAKKLVDFFGTDVLEIIDKEPERLTQVPGIGSVRSQKIMQGWLDQKEISTIMIFLQDKGISTSHATKIYKTYGKNSLAILQENPYRLADEIWGIGFKTADSIAQNLGIDKYSLNRITAGIVFAISQALSSGNLYIELQELKKTTVELLELTLSEHDVLLKKALHLLYDQNKIKLISSQDQHFLGLSQGYFSEKGIAGIIKKLIEYPTISSFKIDAIYASLRTPTQKEILLNEDQQKAILECLQHKITIITGGPGTGKTTLIKKLLSILDEYKLSYCLAAPTGKAAKRITQGTGRPASTLHRLLEYDFTTHSFTHNEKNSLKLDFLIVDESSMIDIFLAYALLKALPYHAHIIFLGDVDQLPSVGAGNFLNDMIASSTIPCIRLHHIFRQSQDSLIIINAHRVNNGQFPVSYMEDAKKDFIFISENEAATFADHITDIFTRKLQHYNINSDETVVLTPMNRGIVGTQSINYFIQNLINKQEVPEHVSWAGTTYRVHDRVMQLKNNYDKLIFNGDCGFIEKIDTENRTIFINFDKRILEYEFSELDEITLSYAITIHKSQGSEYQAVIIPLFMQHFTLLQRNLLYTAITRAKKLCILIGQSKAVAMAIKNNKIISRITFLKHFLTSDLQCR